MTEINKNQSTSSQESGSKKSEKFFYEKFLSSKIAVAAFCFFVGIVATLTIEHFSKSRQGRLAMYSNFPFYHNFAFANDGFFEEMHQMEKEMDRVFAKQEKQMQEAFAKADQGNKSKVSTKEDAENYYYQLEFSGFKKEEILVSVKNNVVNFSAENKKSEHSKNQDLQDNMSFHYSFLATQYDSKKEPEIIREDNKVIVKLAKKK